MKITEFTRDRQVIELGALGAVAGAVGGAVGAAKGAMGGTPAAPGTPAPGAPAAPGAAQDPQQLQKMAAANALQMAERKKQIQDDIKSKQQEIQDLQKQLATIR